MPEGILFLWTGEYYSYARGNTIPMDEGLLSSGGRITIPVPEGLLSLGERITIAMKAGMGGEPLKDATGGENCSYAR